MIKLNIHIYLFITNIIINNQHHFEQIIFNSLIKMNDTIEFNI